MPATGCLLRSIRSTKASNARQFDLNVKGAFFTVQAFLSVLSEQSSIILTASAVHAKGAPGGTLYFASKAAVRSFARTMAAELGGRGIRVNTLSPGIVPTNFFENSNVPWKHTTTSKPWQVTPPHWDAQASR